MDVDGTLTNGKIYLGEQGEIFKVFDTKDGYGIRKILPEHNVIPAIITGRTSSILEKRAGELGITEVHQGKQEKLETMKELLNKFYCPPEQVAYIGDDLPDLPCMQICGICGCPADAVPEVKAVCDFISSKNGGDGAVREFVEWFLKQKHHKNAIGGQKRVRPDGLQRS